MISRQVITGKNATISKPTVVKNITSDVYYMESGYNLYSVIALTSNVLYLNEFTSPVSIYLAAGTTGTLEIFPTEDGGETIDGDLSITLTNEFDGVTLYPLGGGRFSASYWKSAGGSFSGTMDDIPNGSTYVKTENNYTDADATKVSNLSGTNTGDNATNSQYSGLAASKQDALVSGTNIKTINSNSILGSGDLAISASAAWGGITGTLSSQSDLQSALDAKVTDSDVRGGASSLNQRLGTISNFASPNAGGVVVGQYYDNSFQGTASSTLAGAANRIDLAPYYTSVNLPIDQIGCAVSTAVASSNIKIVIYSADTNGWPDTLLYESEDISTATTGYKFATLTFTFSSGVQYWVGVRHSSTATLRTINVSSAVNLGLTSSSASNYATILRRTLTFATPATSPWSFTNSDRVANTTPPSIRFRAA